jgi:hypothetical protein
MCSATRAASVLALLLVVACGGKDKPPPSSPETANDAHDAGDMTQIDEAAWADAGLSPQTSEGAEAAAGNAAAAPVAASEPEDECTPVGVDFEKRARPKMKECYREGKKKDPNLEGTVRVTVAIDYKGNIKSTKITEKTLPNPVAQCMLKAVKATPFPDANKCPDKNISIPMTFPTP